MTDLSAEQLIARGYRRTSNKYRIVSRIDRPDWIAVLAEEMRRAPADFYVPGEPDPAGNWCDYYRRVLSKDKIEGVPHEVFCRIPSSDWDSAGYVEIAE